MNKKEAEIVNEEFISRSDVYNIIPGGTGGFDFLNNGEYGKGTKKRRETMWRINHDQESNRKRRKSLKERWERLKKEQPEVFEEFIRQTSRNVRKAIERIKSENPDYMKGENNPNYGRKHTKDTKRMLSDLKKGCGNPMFGKIWIFNLELLQSKPWPKDEPIPDGW